MSINPTNSLSGQRNPSTNRGGGSRVNPQDINQEVSQNKVANASQPILSGGAYQTTSNPPPYLTSVNGSLPSSSGQAVNLSSIPNSGPPEPISFGFSPFPNTPEIYPQEDLKSSAVVFSVASKFETPGIVTVKRWEVKSTLNQRGKYGGCNVYGYFKYQTESGGEEQGNIHFHFNEKNEHEGKYDTIRQAQNEYTSKDYSALFYDAADRRNYRELLKQKGRNDWKDQKAKEFEIHQTVELTKVYRTLRDIAYNKAQEAFS
jgi:hypothetical protein